MQCRLLLSTVLCLAALGPACAAVETVGIGGEVDAGPTDDERLLQFARGLRGTWTGTTTLMRPLMDAVTMPWDLRWQPDPAQPKSGTLIMGCFSKEGCDLLWRPPPIIYELHEIRADGIVAGVVEITGDASDFGMLFGLRRIELKAMNGEAGSELSFNLNNGFQVGTLVKISDDPTQPPIGQAL